MTRHQLQLLILKGYHILNNGVPTKVEGGLWEYLSSLDEEVMEILVLEELLTWDDEQLKKVNVII